jgi:hypothetical protein
MLVLRRLGVTRTIGANVRRHSLTKIRRGSVQKNAPSSEAYHKAENAPSQSAISCIPELLP